MPSVTEVARNFAEYVDRVAFRGESFVLVRRGRPVAELRPVAAGRRLGDLAGLLASLPTLTRKEADEFATDVEAGRAEMNAATVRDPWQS